MVVASGHGLVAYGAALGHACLLVVGRTLSVAEAGGFEPQPLRVAPFSRRAGCSWSRFSFLGQLVTLSYKLVSAALEPVA